ncbi:MAG TPA: DUF1127 domain-containing protein [Rhizobiales bacterium]|nr:DUF1127 domain-containing protein [Hyphomicrobiales bacterium]
MVKRHIGFIEVNNINFPVPFSGPDNAEKSHFCQQENYAMTCLAVSNQSTARNEIFSRNQNRFQIGRLWHNWKIRRKVRALADQENHILEDIGVRRDEIIWAGRLPLTVNAAIALNDRALRRRQRGN